MYDFKDYNENAEDNVSFKQVKSALSKLNEILKNTNLKLFISGGTVPYLLLNQDSKRMHSDIDTICFKKDIDKIRKVLKKTKYYIPTWDSLNIVKDGKDYGLELLVDNVPVGIYPFNYENNLLTQYTYNPKDQTCKIKQIKLDDLKDYIFTYTSKNGDIYNTMSLEFIKKSKECCGRKKDVVDLKKILETGLIRPNILNRINEIKETQKKTVSDLNDHINQ